MESSISSILKLPHNSKRLTTENDEYDDEQSSWTFYFEDFMYKDEYITCLSSDDCDGASLVSDAASLVAKMSFRRRNCRNLSFKRQRTNEVLVDKDADDDLEDTASSLVNSPKVSYLNQLDTSLSHKGNNYVNYPKEKERICGQINERSAELHVSEKENSYTELKKRGLCFVPVSMLANFITS